MRKFSLMFLIVIVVGISICSCNFNSHSDTDDQLASLESQLAMLSASESAAAERINELLGQIAELENQTDTSAITQPQVESDVTTEKTGFTYNISEGAATITGYVGAEKHLVIPASIDGYTVVAIGDRAFADSLLESVIISENVNSVGWFAFDGCMKLKSITVPSSVTSIGYAAFGNSESPTTIFCHSESFVLQYAKSYGLTYTVI